MEARQRSKPATPSFRLWLRIRHPSACPAQLSREFGIAAEHAYQAGDPRSRRSGLAPVSVHSESYWLGLLDPAQWPPPDMAFPGRPRLQLAAEHLRASAANSLTWALALSIAGFFDRHAALLRRVSAEGGQVSLLIALAADEVGSFSLAPGVAQSFGDLGITLEFELTDD